MASCQKQVIELIDRYLLVVGLGLFNAKEARAQGADKALVKKIFHARYFTPPRARRARCLPAACAVHRGMVFSIESGIYIREEAVGVRLENDFVMGKNKNIDLIDKIPIEADESALKCK